MCRYSLSAKQCYPAFLLVKQCMHKNFISIRYQECILKGLDNYIETLRDKARLEEQDLKFIVKVLEDVKNKDKKKAVKKETNAEVEMKDEIL